MSDAYRRYADSRQQAAAPAPAQALSSPVVGKRPRTEYDVPSGNDLQGYYVRDGDLSAPRLTRDTDSINASYDLYLRSMQMFSYGGSESARPVSGAHGGYSVDDPYIMGMGGSSPAVGAKSRAVPVIGGRPEVSLPPDASSTIFVEGLPANCTRREASHIFRPFVGYKEVRLVMKGSRHPGGDPLVLCFVDFVSAAHAATAMDALQGYKFDEDDPDSVHLRLQFARHPGARSGSGPRGRH